MGLALKYDLVGTWGPGTNTRLTNMGWSGAAAAKSLQSCPTLCDPIDGSPPSSPVPGILQARILEWVAIAFSIQLPTQSGAPPVKFHFLGRAASLPDTAELHTAYPSVLYSHPAQFPKSPSLRYSHSPPCGEPCFPMSSAFKEHVLL